MGPHRSRSRRRVSGTARRGGLAAALLCLAAAVSGCGIVPYFSTIIFGGDEKIPPVYEFPKEKKILVFVSNDPSLHYLSGVEMVRTNLANAISDQLLEHQVAASTVSQARLMNVLEQMSERASMVEIGKACGADFVLRVRIEKLSFQDIPNTTLYTGRMQTAVRVIDVGKGRVFPPVEEWHYLKPLTLVPADDASPTYANVVAKTLVLKMSDTIAKLFYEHDAPKGGDPMSME